MHNDQHQVLPGPSLSARGPEESVNRCISSPYTHDSWLEHFYRFSTWASNVTKALILEIAPPRKRARSWLLMPHVSRSYSID